MQVVVVVVVVVVVMIVMIVLKELKCNFIIIMICQLIIIIQQSGFYYYSHFTDEYIETKKIEYLALGHTDRNERKNNSWPNSILKLLPHHNHRNILKTINYQTLSYAFHKHYLIEPSTKIQWGQCYSSGLGLSQYSVLKKFFLKKQVDSE